MQAEKPWDSQRGTDRWFELPLDVRQTLLSAFDAVLSAALGMPKEHGGPRQQNWRLVGNAKTEQEGSNEL